MSAMPLILRTRFVFVLAFLISARLEVAQTVKSQACDPPVPGAEVFYCLPTESGLSPEPVFTLEPHRIQTSRTPPTEDAMLPLRSPSPAPKSTRVATRIVYVAPVNSLGHQEQDMTISETVHGDCQAGSDVINGPIYRCFAGNYVYDPCWAVMSSKMPAGSVLCMELPWSKSAVRIVVTTGLPSVAGNFHTDLDYPWGVRLVTGENCLAAQGAHGSYNDHVIDYFCGTSNAGLQLLRGVDRARPLWSYKSVKLTGDTLMPGPTAYVRIAWYASYAP